MRITGKAGAKRHGFIESLESRRLLSGGVLDTSFNSPHGVDSVGVPDFTVSGHAVAVQSDGKIVEVGSTNAASYAMIRLNANGQLDNSFGHDGEVVLSATTEGGIADTPYTVVIQSNGDILLAGELYFRDPKFGPGVGDGSMFVSRFLSNGKIDTSFGTGGNVVLDHFDTVTNQAAAAESLAIQNDGKIIVAGYELQGFSNENDNFALARLNTNGTLDKSFNSDGKLNLDLDQNEVAEAVAIDYTGTASTNPDYGKIIVVGRQNEDSWDFQINYRGDYDPKTTFKIVIARYNTNGSLDTSFSGDGHEVTTAGSSAKSVDAQAVTIEAGGKIVIAGSQGTNISSTDHDFFLARFNLNGSLDTSFGSNGHTTTNFGGDDYGTSLVVGALGQQLIAGGTSSGKFALAAYSLNGKPDVQFGTNGIVTTKGDNKVSNVKIALSPTDKIVAAGGTSFNTARYTDITPVISITSTDDVAGEADVVKKVGQVFKVVPNTANLIVSRDVSLPVATRVYFTISGTATMPNAANIKLKKNDYTLSGMTISTLPANNTTGYVDIPAGQTSVTVTMTAIDDSIPEPTELAKFALQSNATYSTVGASSETLSILDNDSTNVVDSADAYVQDGSSAGTNFGSADPLVVKKSGTSGLTRQAYFKFDLSSVSTVNTVTLSLFGELNNTTNTNLESDLYSVADTSWTETGITNNNKPATGTKLGSIIVANMTPQTYTIDVTSYVKAQLAAGHKIISFVLMNPSNSGSAFLINSREASSNQPTLTIT